MEPFVVVKAEIGAQTRNSKCDALVILEANLLVLDRAPQSFDKDVVEDAPATVHADPRQAL